MDIKNIDLLPKEAQDILKDVDHIIDIYRLKPSYVVKPGKIKVIELLSDNYDCLEGSIKKHLNLELSNHTYRGFLFKRKLKRAKS